MTKKLARDCLRDSFWVFFAYRNIARPNLNANSRQDVLSVDTNSLRHLSRRSSSKNYDLQFAKIDTQTDTFKENYNIDELAGYPLRGNHQCVQFV